MTQTSLRAAADGSDNNDGIMVALKVPNPEQHALPGGLPAEDLHVTLAYLGKTADLPPGAVEAIKAAARAACQSATPINARFPTEYGTFENPDEVPFWAKPEGPQIFTFRDALVQQLNVRGLGHLIATNHPFNPHVTLKYLDGESERIPEGFSPSPEQPITFTEVLVSIGEDEEVIPLTEQPAPVTAAAPTQRTRPVRINAQTEQSLRRQVELFNRAAKGSRASLEMVKAVYARGASSARSTESAGSSQHALGVSRVSSFLDMLASNDQSCPDRDLFPTTAPRSVLWEAALTASALGVDEVHDILTAASLIPVTDPRRAFMLNRALALTASASPRVRTHLEGRLRALVADGNSSAARSLRARRQLRDRKGRWIEMGGGVRFKIRKPGTPGGGEWFHGRVEGIDVPNGRVDVRLEDGRLVKVPNDKLEQPKAILNLPGQPIVPGTAPEDLDPDAPTIARLEETDAPTNRMQGDPASAQEMADALDEAAREFKARIDTNSSASRAQAQATQAVATIANEHVQGRMSREDALAQLADVSNFAEARGASAEGLSDDEREAFRAYAEDIQDVVAAGQESDAEVARLPEGPAPTAPRVDTSRGDSVPPTDSGIPDGFDFRRAAEQMDLVVEQLGELRVTRDDGDLREMIQQLNDDNGDLQDEPDGMNYPMLADQLNEIGDALQEKLDSENDPEQQQLLTGTLMQVRGLAQSFENGPGGDTGPDESNDPLAPLRDLADSLDDLESEDYGNIGRGVSQLLDLAEDGEISNDQLIGQLREAADAMGGIPDDMGELDVDRRQQRLEDAIDALERQMLQPPGGRVEDPPLPGPDDEPPVSTPDEVQAPETADGPQLPDAEEFGKLAEQVAEMADEYESKPEVQARLAAIANVIANVGSDLYAGQLAGDEAIEALRQVDNVINGMFDEDDPISSEIDQDVEDELNALAGDVGDLRQAIQDWVDAPDPEDVPGTPARDSGDEEPPAEAYDDPEVQDEIDSAPGGDGAEPPSTPEAPAAETPEPDENEMHRQLLVEGVLPIEQSIEENDFGLDSRDEMAEVFGDQVVDDWNAVARNEIDEDDPQPGILQLRNRLVDFRDDVRDADPSREGYTNVKDQMIQQAEEWIRGLDDLLAAPSSPAPTSEAAADSLEALRGDQSLHDIHVGEDGMPLDEAIDAELARVEGDYVDMPYALRNLEDIAAEVEDENPEVADRIRAAIEAERNRPVPEPGRPWPGDEVSSDPASAADFNHEQAQVALQDSIDQLHEVNNAVANLAMAELEDILADMKDDPEGFDYRDVGAVLAGHSQTMGLLAEGAEDQAEIAVLRLAESQLMDAANYLADAPEQVIPTRPVGPDQNGVEVAEFDWVQMPNGRQFRVVGFDPAEEGNEVELYNETDGSVFVGLDDLAEMERIDAPASAAPSPEAETPAEPTSYEEAKRAGDALEPDAREAFSAIAARASEVNGQPLTPAQAAADAHAAIASALRDLADGDFRGTGFVRGRTVPINEDELHVLRDYLDARGNAQWRYNQEQQGGIPEHQRTSESTSRLNGRNAGWSALEGHVNQNGLPEAAPASEQPDAPAAGDGLTDRFGEPVMDGFSLVEERDVRGQQVQIYRTEADENGRKFTVEVGLSNGNPVYVVYPNFGARRAEGRNVGNWNEVAAAIDEMTQRDIARREADQGRREEQRRRREEIDAGEVQRLADLRAAHEDRVARGVDDFDRPLPEGWERDITADGTTIYRATGRYTATNDPAGNGGLVLLHRDGGFAQVGTFPDWESLDAGMEADRSSRAVAHRSTLARRMEADGFSAEAINEVLNNPDADAARAALEADPAYRRMADQYEQNRGAEIRQPAQLEHDRKFDELKGLVDNLDALSPATPEEAAPANSDAWDLEDNEVAFVDQLPIEPDALNALRDFVVGMPDSIEAMSDDQRNVIAQEIRDALDGSNGDGLTADQRARLNEIADAVQAPSDTPSGGAPAAPESPAPDGAPALDDLVQQERDLEEARRQARRSGDMDQVRDLGRQLNEVDRQIQEHPDYQAQAGNPPPTETPAPQDEDGPLPGPSAEPPAPNPADAVPAPEAPPAPQVDPLAGRPRPPRPAGAPAGQETRYHRDGVIRDRNGNEIYAGLRVRGLRDGAEGIVVAVQQQPPYARIEWPDGRRQVRAGRQLVDVDPRARRANDFGPAPAAQPVEPVAVPGFNAPAAPAAPQVQPVNALPDPQAVQAGLNSIRDELPRRLGRAGMAQRNLWQAGFGLERDAIPAIQAGNMEAAVGHLNRAAQRLDNGGRGDLATRVREYANQLQGGAPGAAPAAPGVDASELGRRIDDIVEMHRQGANQGFPLLSDVGTARSKLEQAVDRARAGDIEGAKGLIGEAIRAYDLAALTPEFGRASQSYRDDIARRGRAAHELLSAIEANNVPAARQPQAPGASNPDAPVMPGDFLENRFRGERAPGVEDQNTPLVEDPRIGATQAPANALNPNAQQRDYNAWGARAGEIAGAARTRPSAKDMFDLPANGQEFQDAVRAAYGAEDGIKFGDGFTLQFRGASGGGGSPQITASFLILDKNGSQVGSVSRRLDRARNGKLTAYNSSMSTGGGKGGGFATAFNRYMENWYIANGFESVSVSAAGGGGYTGGFVWAVNGFGWKNPGDARGMLTAMQRKASTDADRAQVAALIARNNAGDVPTPMELALVGWRPGMAASGRWLGKTHMTQQNWGGIKHLTPNDQNIQQRVAYDFAKQAGDRVKQGVNVIAPANKADLVRRLGDSGQFGDLPLKEAERAEFAQLVSRGKSVASLSPSAKRRIRDWAQSRLVNGNDSEYPGQREDLLEIRNKMRDDLLADYPISDSLGVGEELRNFTLSDFRANQKPGWNFEPIGAAGGINGAGTFKVTHVPTGKVFFVKNDTYGEGFGQQGGPRDAEKDVNTFFNRLGIAGVNRAERSNVESSMVIFQRLGDNMDLTARPKNAASYSSRSRAEAYDNFANPEDVISVWLADVAGGNGDRHNNNWQMAKDSDGRWWFLPVDNGLLGPGNGWAGMRMPVASMARRIKHYDLYKSGVGNLARRMGRDNFKATVLRLIEQQKAALGDGGFVDGSFQSNMVNRLEEIVQNLDPVVATVI